jgi:hypothetical protein
MVVVRLGQDQTEGFVITSATWSEFLRRLGRSVAGAVPLDKPTGGGLQNRSDLNRPDLRSRP